MDISPGDSTPTSEASYTHSSTPTTQQNNEGPLLLANALPRLASHPSTSTPSQMHFSNSSCVGGKFPFNVVVDFSFSLKKSLYQMQRQRVH